MNVECPGCEKELHIGPAEAFLFRGVPLECTECGEPLGTIGPDATEQLRY